MNLILNLILCGVLVLVTVAVGIYRHWLENRCDHYIHLHGDSHDIAIADSQAADCRRAEAVDKLRTALIVAVIVYAIVIAGFATWNAWNAANP